MCIVFFSVIYSIYSLLYLSLYLGMGLVWRNRLNKTINWRNKMRYYELVAKMAWTLFRLDMGGSNVFKTWDEVPTKVQQRYIKTVEEMDRQVEDRIEVELTQGQSTHEGRFLDYYLYNTPINKYGYFANGGENTLTFTDSKRRILRVLKKLEVDERFEECRTNLIKSISESTEKRIRLTTITSERFILKAEYRKL